MASIVRSQLQHTFPLSDFNWPIDSTTIPWCGNQADHSAPEQPVEDSAVREIEAESEDHRVRTHCSSLQAASNGVENPTEMKVILDPAVAEKTTSRNGGSNLLIRFRSKEKSIIVAEEAEKQPPSQSESPDLFVSIQEESTTKVWNLRPRKPAYKKYASNSTIRGPFGVPSDDSAATPRKCVAVPGEVKETKKKKKKKVKFSVALSKQEIGADFLLLTGAKPSRRPKKRSRTVQKLNDSISPGQNLPAAVTVAMYDASLYAL